MQSLQQEQFFVVKSSGVIEQLQLLINIHFDTLGPHKASLQVIWSSSHVETNDSVKIMENDKMKHKICVILLKLSKIQLTSGRKYGTRQKFAKTSKPDSNFVDQLKFPK